MNGDRSAASLDRAWHRARRAISVANFVAVTTGAKGSAKKTVDTQSARAKAHRRLLRRTTTRVLRIARKLRDRADCEAEDADLSDHSLSKLAPLTDHLALSDYAGLLHTCPRLVNVVSVTAHRTRPPCACTVDAPCAPLSCLHSWRRPSPCRARARACRSTCTRLHRAVRTPSTAPSGLRPCSWRLMCRGRACSFFTPAASSALGVRA